MAEKYVCLLLDSGEALVLWRQANVVTISKKEDEKVSSNYRPVILTSIVGKLMEPIIAKNVGEHLHKHNLINHSQNSFTKVMLLSVLFCPSLSDIRQPILRYVSVSSSTISL